jgi:hypothetical protein
MLLVPRQLQRAGMTGTVPYYGGRFSPAQAYAAAHPSAPVPRSATSATPRVGVGPGPAATGQPAPSPPATNLPDTLLSLQHLLDAGVITRAEYQDLRARVTA